jgi:hypothetical protein
MEDLNLQQICAKFVPQFIDEQKQLHVFVCHELLDDIRNDKNFLSRVITGDKTLLYYYDPETKQQSSQGVIFRMSL